MNAERIKRIPVLTLLPGNHEYGDVSSVEKFDRILHFARGDILIWFRFQLVRLVAPFMLVSTG